MIFFLYLTAFLVAVGLHLVRSSRPLTKLGVVDILLVYLLTIFVGVGGILGTLAHTLWAAETAAKIGWSPGSPFQYEVAMANLAFGVLGMMSFRRRGDFWTAAGLGAAVFLLGCAAGHFMDLFQKGNYAPYNVGPGIILYDVIMPVFLLVLLGIRGRLTREINPDGFSGRNCGI